MSTVVVNIVVKVCVLKNNVCLQRRQASLGAAPWMSSNKGCSNEERFVVVKRVLEKRQASLGAAPWVML